MEANTTEEALASLEMLLRNCGATVRRLRTDELERDRTRWRELYGPALGRRAWSWSREGYDWHVFSFQRHEAVEGAVATQAMASSTGATHHFLVLSARDDLRAGLAVEADHAIDLGPLGDDWTMLAEDGSWSMSWTSEGEGPFFARP
ncbi:MAG: hypothetical protein KC621_35005 [Myxococcales bacterium]|nr:hypothetical protein [Myxococcales bacterium]